MLKIGNVSLKHGLVLAPMADVTDLAFRNVAKDCGAEYMVSEMVSAKALCYRDEKTFSLMKFYPSERPIAIQIFGSEPEIMAEAARIIAASENPPEVIDINMGCPVRKIAGNGEGSALMLDPVRAGKIVRAVSDAVSLPVTVKIRSGWDGSSINAPDFAQVCEQSGAAAICVHGRTKEQMYADPVDRKVIAAVKKAVSLPVIGNGGINTPEDALSMFSETGCDGVAIARGAMGNPWIFRQTAELIEKGSYTLPTDEERLSACLHQLELMEKEKNAHIAVCEGRRQMAYYIKGVSGAAALRSALMAANDTETMKRLLTEAFNKNKEE